MNTEGEIEKELERERQNSFPILCDFSHHIIIMITFHGHMYAQCESNIVITICTHIKSLSLGKSDEQLIKVEIISTEQMFQIVSMIVCLGKIYLIRGQLRIETFSFQRFGVVRFDVLCKKTF